MSLCRGIWYWDSTLCWHSSQLEERNDKILLKWIVGLAATGSASRLTTGFIVRCSELGDVASYRTLIAETRFYCQDRQGGVWLANWICGRSSSKNHVCSQPLNDTIGRNKLPVTEILATDVSIRLKVLTVVLLNVPAFWNILLYRKVGPPRHFVW
jgi:hypothetical protein